MKRRIILYIIYSLITLIIGYFLYHVIKVEIIYNSTRLDEIKHENRKHIEVIDKFVDDSIIINYTYLVEKNDTIITFDYGDKSGLLWMISGLENEKNIKVLKDKGILNRENGTHKKFISQTNPFIDIIYIHGRELRGDIYCIILPQDRALRHSEMCDYNNVYELEVNNVIIIKNDKDRIVYRIEIGQSINLFLFKQNTTLYALFLQ